MADSSRFFKNTSCFYFPCHKSGSDQDFNCLFCYCPLYLFPDCGGHPVRRGSIKDCSCCDKPHRSGGYEHVMGRLTRYFEETQARFEAGSEERQGRFCWNELTTSDPEAAKRFYTALFGWSLSNMGCGPYAVFALGNERVAGVTSLPDRPGDQAPMWLAHVRVEDADAAAARVGDLGAEILVSPRDIPGLGRFFVLRDPQGAVLKVISYFEDNEQAMGGAIGPGQP